MIALLNKFHKKEKKIVAKLAHTTEFLIQCIEMHDFS